MHAVTSFSLTFSHLCKVSHLQTTGRCLDARQSVIVRWSTEQSLIYEGSRVIPQSFSSAAAAPTCFDPTPRWSATPDMCALSERQDLFSTDGKFISSEDGATPIEFYNAILFFFPPKCCLFLFCSLFFCHAERMLFYTWWTLEVLSCFSVMLSSDVQHVSGHIGINSL